jgi:cytochrome c oxidase subunit 3
MFAIGLADAHRPVRGWFHTVIGENQKGMYNMQVDKSFRMGMMWFIFSEVMFFAAFFGALFYARQFSVPWLGGEGVKIFNKLLLWQNFENAWPTNGPGEARPARRRQFETIPAFGLPAINTADPADLGRHDHDRAPRAA